MSCPFSSLDGAYVLGSLSPSERQDFEGHLSTCDECSRNVRELAGLPGLLARVDRSVLDFETPEEALPDTLLPGLVAQVRRRRRRGLLTTVGAAAAAALVAAGVALLVTSGDEGQAPEAASPSASASATPTPTPSSTPTPTATPTPTGTPPQAILMTTVGGAPVRGWLAFESVAWGTRIDLECSYSAPDPGVEGYDGSDGYGAGATPRYAMYVRTKDGWVDEVGTWRGVEGSTMHVTAPTSARRSEIASVVVRTIEGRPVLRHTS